MEIEPGLDTRTIRQRLLSDGTHAHTYYFEEPGLVGASSMEEYFVGQIVRIDPLYNKAGWTQIVGLVGGEKRPDTQWFCMLDPAVRERFTLPEGPVNPEPFREIEIWRNNAGALLELEFTPAHWYIGLSSPEVHPPVLRFVSCLITSEEEYDQKPHGYMHLAGTRAPVVVSDSYCVDDFTRALDAFYVARWWSGDTRPVWGRLTMPGLGASVQKHFHGQDPQTLLGRKIYLA